MPGKPRTIDDYLRQVTPEKRAALERLRAQIHRVLGDAEECISYSMPAFRASGKVVAGFLATTKGCSYFPFSGTTLSTIDKQLTAYDRTKSALHWDPKRGLPPALVRLLLMTRLRELGVDVTVTKGRPAEHAVTSLRKPSKKKSSAVKAKTPRAV